MIPSPAQARLHLEFELIQDEKERYKYVFWAKLRALAEVCNRNWLMALPAAHGM